MQNATDDWWAARLCYGQVWIMQKKAEVVTMTTAGQAAPFYGLVYTDNAQVWNCPSTGHKLSLGFLSFYQGERGPNGESATHLLGLPLSDEYGTADGKTRQDFEPGSFIYDGSVGDPWRIYAAPIGHELAAREQVATAGASLAQAKQQAALDAQTIAEQGQQISALTAQQAAAQAQAQTPAPAPSPSMDDVAHAAAHIFGAAFASALAATLAPSVAPAGIASEASR